MGTFGYQGVSILTTDDVYYSRPKAMDRHCCGHTFPVIMVLIFLPTIDYWYMHEIVGPRLQREFGFWADFHSIKVGEEQWEVFIITAVHTGGILEKAGFRTGDIPIGYYHGFERGFYNDLLRTKDGMTAEITVVQASDLSQDNWKSLGRKVTIPGKVAGRNPTDI